MLEKEYKIQVGVYKVKTFRTTQVHLSNRNLYIFCVSLLFGVIKCAGA